RGDSMFLTPDHGLSMVTISPTGAIARIAAAPAAADLFCVYMAGDALGRVMCQVPVGQAALAQMTSRLPATMSRDTAVTLRSADSTPILAVHLQTHRV